MAVRRVSTSNIYGTKSSKIWDQETFPGYFESISSIVVPSGGSSFVTFSNIPQSYKHLQIRAVHQEPSDSIQLQFNNVTSNVYVNHHMYSDGASTNAAYTSQSLSQFGILFGTNYGCSGSTFGATICDIYNYSNSSLNTIVRSFTGATNNNTFDRVGYYSGAWLNTTPVTSIKIFPRTSGFNLVQNSVFSLYGIRG